jgi:hypothetical protein
VGIDAIGNVMVINVMLSHDGSPGYLLKVASLGSIA